MEVNVLPDEGRVGEWFVTNSAVMDLAEIVLFPDLVDILLRFQLLLVYRVVIRRFFKRFELHVAGTASNRNFVDFME